MKCYLGRYTHGTIDQAGFVNARSMTDALAAFRRMFDLPMGGNVDAKHGYIFTGSADGDWLFAWDEQDNYCADYVARMRKLTN